MSEDDPLNFPDTDWGQFAARMHAYNNSRFSDLDKRFDSWDTERKAMRGELSANTGICAEIKTTLDRDIKSKLDIVAPNFKTINAMAAEYNQRAQTRALLSKYFGTTKRFLITLATISAGFSGMIAMWQWALSHIK